MVLGELGSKIGAAMRKVVSSKQVDESLLEEMLQEMTDALAAADVDVDLTSQFRSAVKKKVNLKDMPAGLNKRKVIQKAVMEELVRLVDPGKKPFAPKKGKINVIMFVGLQGAGKTTTITKFGYHYRRKGWKVGLVCADTFRAGAYAQLKQNAVKAKIAFYGSHTETDPVKAAREGVDEFRKERYEIILVDTSGRHKQEEGLFKEMQQISDQVKPDDIVFVLDASIGQAARPQAEAFRDAVDVGSVIITKMDGHAKGGGALSAVAATGSPIVFLGTGEHFNELDVFNSESFVRRLLGMGDMVQLVETFKDAGLEEKSKALMTKLETGEKFSLRDMREQFESVLSLGPLSKLMQMMPGMAQQMMPPGQEAESKKRLKKFMTILDSMTDQELDDPDVICASSSRIRRVAYGSGAHLVEVHALLEQFLQMQKLVGKMAGMESQMKQHGMRAPKNLANATSQIANMMDPRIIQQMGGVEGLSALMKQMGGDDMMSNLANMMGGAGRGRRRR